MEDRELWYRTWKSSNFKITSEPLMFYREVGRDYYKKYITHKETKDYILKKHANASYWKNYFKNRKIKKNIYYIFNLFGKESFLIKKEIKSLTIISKYILNTYKKNKQ